MCFGGGGANRAQREAEAEEARRTAAIRTGTERVRGVFSSPGREAQIGEFVGATRNMLTGEVNRQQKDATRQNRFALARSGQIGGQLQADRSRKLGEAHGRGLLDVERRAQGAGSDLRSADEEAQARLIGLVQGGLDTTSAAQQAAQSMRSNLQAGAGQRNADQLGDVFGGFADFFQRSRDRSDRARADRQFSPFGGFTSQFTPGRG